MQVKTELEEHGTGDEKETYQQVDSCWALGDCSANMEVPLPALAQVRPLLSAATKAAPPTLHADAELPCATHRICQCPCSLRDVPLVSCSIRCCGAQQSPHNHAMCVVYLECQCCSQSGKLFC